MHDGIIVEFQEEIACITISRPQRGNALNGPSWKALLDAVVQASSQNSTRCIIVAGAEGHFCAGDDLKDSELKLGGDAAERYAETINRTYEALSRAPVPVIAAISGACMSAGLSLALHCDFRFADFSAKIGVPAARIGDYYPATLCHRLARLAGISAARSMLMTGDFLDGETAQSCGLVDRLIDDVQAEAMEYGRNLASRAPLVVKAAKQMMEAMLAGMFESRHDHFDGLMDEIKLSWDREEGRRAFIEKRPPRFRGH